MTTRTITVEALRIAMNAMGYQHNVEEVFALLPAEPAGDGLREALVVIAGISESRVTVEQADALGYLDGYLAATPVGLRWENWHDPFPPAAPVGEDTE